VPAFDCVEGENAALWPFRFTMQQFRSVLINPTGEMPSPRNGFEANPVLNEKDGFQPSEVNQQIVAADFATGGSGTRRAQEEMETERAPR